MRTHWRAWVQGEQAVGSGGKRWKVAHTQLGTARDAPSSLTLGGEMGMVNCGRLRYGCVDGARYD